MDQNFGVTLMGAQYRENLDSAAWLDPDVAGFRSCRLCGDDGRLDGILWCLACAGDIIAVAECYQTRFGPH